jgi:flagellar protein FlaJ
MYLIGREMGGDPQILGELIGENMNEVNRLRQQRTQAATTLVGLLYGITAAATFAFFIGLEVVRVLSNMDLDIGNAGGFAGQLINTSAYNIPLINFLLVTVIMFSAMLSSLMVRTVDGGHKINTYVHFVAMAWIAALVSIMTRVVVSSFLSV